MRVESGSGGGGGGGGGADRGISPSSKFDVDPSAAVDVEGISAPRDNT